MCMKIALVLASLLLLSACAGGSQDTAPSAQSTPSAVAQQPTPTPAPTQPAISDLVLTPNGFGDLVMGQPYTNTDPETSLLIWDDTICDFPEDEPMLPDFPGWFADYPLTADGKLAFFPALDGPSPDSRVVEVTIQSPDLRTAEGLGVGSSLAELSAVYADSLVRGGDDQFASHTVTGDHGRLMFWTYGTEDTVSMMYLKALDQPLNYHFYITGCS